MISPIKVDLHKQSICQVQHLLDVLVTAAETCDRLANSSNDRTLTELFADAGAENWWMVSKLQQHVVPAAYTGRGVNIPHSQFANAFVGALEKCQAAGARDRRETAIRQFRIADSAMLNWVSSIAANFTGTCLGHEFEDIITALECRIKNFQLTQSSQFVHGVSVGASAE